MRLKKTVFLGVAVALMPVLAQAFVVFNDTRQDSTVKITSGGAHLCSNMDPVRGITHPGQHNNITTPQIKVLCLDSGATCEADIYATPGCDMGHTVAPMGHASLDVGSGNIKSAYVLKPYTVEYSAQYIAIHGK